MNTKIFYEYRDSEGWSEYEEVVLAGELTPQDGALINSLLEGGEFFIPADVGLEELQDRMDSYPSVNDHIWHRWERFVLTADEPTVELTAADFMSLVRDVQDLGWNETEAFLRHGFLAAW